MLKHFVITILLCIAPISELRGAIPYGYSFDIPVYILYPLAIITNSLVAPLLYLFLDTLHKFLYRYSWYKNFFDKFEEKSRRKISEKVDKYGYWGIMLFVGIPLPITGAYTGTLGAWVLGLSRKKTYLAVLGGVMISATIVTLITFLGVQTFSFLIKKF